MFILTSIFVGSGDYNIAIQGCDYPLTKRSDITRAVQIFVASPRIHTVQDS
jgi:hypothetical protein